MGGGPASGEVGDAHTPPPPSGGQAFLRRRLIAKTAGVTVVLTFLATQTAGWVFGRVADNLAGAATPAIKVESSGPIAEPWNVVVPQTPLDLEGSKVRGEAVTRWAVNQGGGPSDSVEIKLTVWGNRDYAVILDAIQASDVDCRAAPAWTRIDATVGGAVPERVVTIDLDSSQHVGVPKPDPSSDENFRFPLQVSRSSLEVLTVRASTATLDCSFALDVVFRDGGQQKTYRVDDDGAPFRVLSPRAANARMEWHLASEGLWTPTKA